MDMIKALAIYLIPFSSFIFAIILFILIKLIVKYHNEYMNQLEMENANTKLHKDGIILSNMVIIKKFG